MKYSLIPLLWVFLSLPLPVVAKTDLKLPFPFYGQQYGGRSLALSQAFCAQADDMSAVWFNPAGLGFIRHPRFFLSHETRRVKHLYDPQKFSGQEYNRSGELERRGLNFFSLFAPALIMDIPVSFALSYYRYYPDDYQGWEK